MGAVEYWLVIAGQIDLRLPALDAHLAAGDLAILRQGVQRSLSAAQRAQVALARE